MLVSKSPLLLIHLTGLALAVGSVLILDLRLATLLTGRRINQADLTLIRALSPFTTAGLALLLISGIGFLLHYYSNDHEMLANPKLHAKAIIVSILTLNGLLVERVVLRHVLNNEGLPLFSGIQVATQIEIITIASVSCVSWYSIVLLGAVRELNFSVNVGPVMAVYGLSVASTVLGALALKLIFYRPDGHDEKGTCRLVSTHHTSQQIAA